MQFEAYKVIANAEIDSCPSACNVLPRALLVARASGTCVVPLAMQREAQNHDIKEHGGRDDG